MSQAQPDIPLTLPAGLVAYRRSPTFTDQTLPNALRKDHATKPGVWALIHVVEGELLYQVPAWGYDELLTPEQPGIVAPEILHSVTPQGPLQMYVEFYALPEQGPADPHTKPTLPPA